MSIANAVFEFIAAKVESADTDSALYNAEVHPSLYEKMRDGSRYIRIGDVQSSVPEVVYGAGGTLLIKEFDAFLTVQCLVRPVSQGLADLLEARNKATDIAKEVVRQISEGEITEDETVCDCIVVRKEDDWLDVSTVRHAVSYLMLRLNDRSYT